MTDWLQFWCDDKEHETKKLNCYFGLLNNGQQQDKIKLVFINLSITFVISKTLQTNQPICRFENNNVPILPNHQDNPKHDIDRLVPRTHCLRINYRINCLITVLM